MNAFLTGSRIYGTSINEDTDVDVVIFVDQYTASILIENSDLGKGPCKYGKLNLIITTEPEQYAGWLLAKVKCQLCKNENPNNFDRDTAIAIHNKIRDEYKLLSDSMSG